MKIPKTPIAFDYDLWTTEDGKCMVRVKRTGEVSEVDRKVMRILRAEEKRIRRSYGSDNTSEDEDGALSLEEVFTELLPHDIPILRNLACGHTLPTMSLPLGIEVEMDADRGTLTLLG